MHKHLGTTADTYYASLLFEGMSELGRAHAAFRVAISAALASGRDPDNVTECPEVAAAAQALHQVVARHTRGEISLRQAS